MNTQGTHGTTERDARLAPVRLLATASKKETLLHRIGFLEGAIEGIRLYAIWRNGEQLVGCLEKPLKEVLRPYQEELVRLTNEVANAQAEAPEPR
jgi:hypothetical protein